MFYVPYLPRSSDSWSFLRNRTAATMGLKQSINEERLTQDNDRRSSSSSSRRSRRRRRGVWW